MKFMDDATAPIADDSAKPKGKLRWYQFSLRTLLMFVTLVAGLCSWYAAKRRQADRQAAAVKTLESHGYHIQYDYDYNYDPLHRTCDIPTPHPNWLVQLVGYDFLYDVYAVGGRATLPDCIKCREPALTDADMAAFEQLPELRVIKLCNIYGNPAKATDKGIAHLKKLKSLEFLDLSDTLVTDAGVRDLQNAISSLKICRVTRNPAIPFEWPEEECVHITTTIEIP
jgi:hypothetical protein